MGSTYNSLLLENSFFPYLIFLFFFFFFPFFLFPTFSLFYLCVPYFFFLFLLSLKMYSHFLILYKRTREMCTNHDQLISLYFFLLHFSNFIKMCARRCAQIMTYFFLLVDINLNHNVILYFFITLLILYW